MAVDLYGPSEGLDPAKDVAGLDLYAPDPAAPGPLKKGFEAGVAGVKASLYGFGALAARSVGATGLEKSALEASAAAHEGIADQPKVEDVNWKSPGEVFDHFKYLLGAAVPSLGLIFAGGALGRAGGKVAARGVSEQATKDLLVRTGMFGGAVAPDVALEAGSIFPEALKTGVESPGIRAAAGGAAAASLDFLPLLAAEKYLKAVGTGGVASILKGALKGAPVGAALEGAQETGQEFIERAAAGQPLTGDEAYSAYLNAAAGGAAPGAVFGAGIGGFRGTAKEQEKAPPPAPEVSPEPVVSPPAETAPLSPADQEIADYTALAARHTTLTEQASALEAQIEEARGSQESVAARRAALDEEIALPVGERREKEAIIKERRALQKEAESAKSGVESLGGQLHKARTAIEELAPQVQAADNKVKNRALLAATPEGLNPAIVPKSGAIVPDSGTIQTKPPTDAEQVDRAVKGVHALMREQGMPLTTTPESFATPDGATVQSRREVALATVAERAPREAAKAVSEQTRQGAVEAAVVQATAPAVKAVVEAKAQASTKGYTPAKQEALTRKLTDSLNSVAQEAAASADPAAHIQKMVPRALAGQVDKGTAKEIADTMAKAVGEWRTYASKGAKVTETPEFKNWFGASKVVDEKGAPLTVYHGTTGRHTEFDRGKRGANFRNPVSSFGTFFTADREVAEEFGQFAADKKWRVTEGRLNPRGRVVAAHLSLQNPVDIDATGWSDRSPELVVALQAAKSAGNDGAIIRNWVDGSGTKIQYVAFDSAQIKDVRNANPTDNPDILKSQAALTSEQFAALPPVAQAAALDAFNAAMAERGTALLGRLRKLVGDDPNLTVRTFTAPSGSPIGGYTRTGPYKAMISLALNAKDVMGLMDHEGFHYLEDQKLDARERAILRTAFEPGKPHFEKLLEKVRAYDIANKTNLADEVAFVPAEARAYGFEFWRRGELQVEGHIARVFEKLKQFLDRIANLIRGQGFQSLEDVFAAIDRGAFAERQVQENQGVGGIELSSRAEAEKWYRSALTDQIATLPIKSAPAQGWRDAVKGLLNKGLVKQAEIDAVGLEEFLDVQGREFKLDDYIGVLAAKYGGYDEEGVPKFRDQQITSAEYAELRRLQSAPDNKGRITKEQVSQFVRENGVRVEEVELGVRQASQQGQGVHMSDGMADYLAAYDLDWPTNQTGWTDLQQRLNVSAERAGRGSTRERDRLHGLAAEALRHSDAVNADGERVRSETKFSDPDLSLPGGKDYRELLLTLPSKQERGYSWEWFDPSTQQSMKYATEQEARAAAPSGAGVQRVQVSERNPDFRSSHFDQPNVLAHVRFNERTDSEGKRVLFLEEIQSDWAQSFKKQRQDWAVTRGDSILRIGSRADVEEWLNLHGREGVTVAPHIANTGGVPSAPFVGKTEAWVALSLKRMIRYAAENGFEKIAWTTGAQQVERYTSALRKNVDAIEWTKTKDGVQLVGYKGQGERSAGGELRRIANDALDRNGRLGFDTRSEALRAILDHADWQNRWGDLPATDVQVLQRYRNEVRKGERTKVVDTTKKENELSDAIGKAMADRIRNDPNQTGLIEGENIRIDDTGMAGFYDRIVPSVANEVLRKLGGGRVEKVALDQAIIFGDFTTQIIQKLTPAERTAADKLVNEAEPGKGLSWTAAARQVAPHLFVFQQPGFTITPALATRAARGLDLFSKAARDMDREMTAGELEREQFHQLTARIMDQSELSNTTGKQALGALWDDASGSVERWWKTWMATPNYIGKFSKGYENVRKVLTALDQYKATQISRWTKEALSLWHDGSMSRADELAVGSALMERTSHGYTLGSPELASILGPLTAQQRKAFDQATAMASGLLDQEFEVDKAMWLKNLPADEAATLIANRQVQVQKMKAEGYIPERRYGDHTVTIIADIMGEDGKHVPYVTAFERYETARGAANTAAEYENVIKRTGAKLRVEVGINYKAERDTTVSIQQFLDTARRNGVNLTQPERERIVRSLTTTDSLRRNRMMRRQNKLGYSEDITRILHEFAVGMVSKIAYNQFAHVVDAAADGSPVDVQLTPAGPQVKIDPARNLWREDGPKSGFYRNQADELTDYNLVPDHTGEWSRKLRGAGMLYFIGGSLAQGVTNATQVPMFTIPWLSQYTPYTNAASISLKAMGQVWASIGVLRDVNSLKNPDVKIGFVDAIPGLRAALIAAAEDGTNLDTEIHQIMGIAQGTQKMQSRATQKAMDAWMAPFRVSEQANRIASFIAAYRIGTENKLTDRALYQFAKGVVDNTQNVYSPANRPGMARNSIGAMLFMFKSFPLFAIETMHLLYKENPKAARNMLLGFAIMSGVNGLPFAGTLQDLVDTISQRLFGSPFNSRRAMRNVIKDATEALTGVDLSSIVLHGIANDMLGEDISSRLGLGSFVPGTRIGAADADYGRVLEQLLGAPYAMVAGAVRGGAKVLKGDYLDALRQGGPVAVRNLVKGAEQMDRGFAVDAQGRKLVDATGWESLWQSFGFTSSALAKAYEVDAMDRQVDAFYTQVRKDMTHQIVKAAQDNDPAKMAETLEFVRAWNQSYPAMPIGFDAATIRRDIAEAGVPLGVRRLLQLPRALRSGSASAEGISLQ